MASIIERLDMNSVCQKPGLHICETCDKQLSHLRRREIDFRVQITLLTGVVYKKNRRGSKVEPCGTANNNSSKSERVDPFLPTWNWRLS